MLVWVFEKQLIWCDFPTQPSLKFRMSSSYVGRMILLMPQVRGELPDCNSKWNNHVVPPRFAEEHLWVHRASEESGYSSRRPHELPVYKRPPQSAHLHWVKHLLGCGGAADLLACVPDVKPTKLQQLCDAIVSVWTNDVAAWLAEANKTSAALSL